MKIGMPELIIILVIVIILFGHRTIPKLIQSLKDVVGKRGKKKTAVTDASKKDDKEKL
ncbi:MAG: twin-arginine translocase TatA/TatE family subunit [Lachnospiraceae bacterium]|nr:twin-arginine translocase TatA/TatE family subunit [Lachnospiraceae bacterium]